VIPLNKQLRAALIEIQQSEGKAQTSLFVITTERSDRTSAAAVVNLFAVWFRALTPRLWTLLHCVDSTAVAFGNGNDLGERLHFRRPQKDPSDIATQIMAAMVRRPPKPHEDMKLGKSKATPRDYSQRRERGKQCTGSTLQRSGFRWRCHRLPQALWLRI
jgi:hypothetical protein